MSFLSGWDEIFESLEVHRKKYGGTSIGASVAGASSGKGFRFPDEEAANKIIKSFEDRVQTIGERKRLIRKAHAELERRFSDDPVSEEYGRKAMDSLAKLGELNDSALKYAQNYVRKIETAKQAKHADDGGIGGSMHKIGESVL